MKKTRAKRHRKTKKEQKNHRTRRKPKDAEKKPKDARTRRKPKDAEKKPIYIYIYM